MAEPTPDLQQAIQAASRALSDGEDDVWSPDDAARIAVEAAWPHAEGTIANAWAKVERQREANAAMQRQTDDARATARGAMRKQLALTEELQALQDKVERLDMLHETASNVLTCLKVGNTTTAMSLLRHALDREGG